MAKKKVRVDLKKNRSKPARDRGWTRGYHAHGYADDDTVQQERVRAKGELSRRRTIITEERTEGDTADMPAVDVAQCKSGRVLRVEGLYSSVADAEGRVVRCAVRRVLRNLLIDERNIVAPGDRVWFRPEGAEGVIERVEPRHGVLTRESRGREQVLVANVDQMVVVTSLAEPALKPHLIDRYLVSAEQGRIQPIVCLNKVDLVDPADYQQLIGMYCQLGVPALLTSAQDGRGIEQLRAMLRDRETVFAGQSGVGKSSLLNALQPDLALAVREVSETTQKGKHTTTTAQLIRLSFGGWVVDTPGIRQFALWDVIPEEVEGYFREFRPFVPLCRFPDCSHTREDSCAVLEAVRRHRIAVQRYESYLGLLEGANWDA